MQQITNYTDFEGLILLDAGGSEKQEYIDAYCIDIQERYLKLLFGEKLFAEFYVRADNAVDKFNELITGKAAAITYNGSTFIYTGLKKMLDLFTYYHYVQEPEYASSVGQTMGVSENGTTVMPYFKLCDRFNEARKLFYEAVRYMDYKNSIEANLFDYTVTNFGTTNIYGI